jgi:hypothetical protein
MNSENEKNETLPTPVGHNSRAITQATSNQDMVFIPPKTPVRSKTRDTQYNTPLKLVTKSGKFFIFVKQIYCL